jgi:hypothetical protein
MDVFFYGLFMDINLLRTKGIEPSNPRKGYLDHYTLKIGDRASLVPLRTARAYGILMNINDGLVRQLYSESSVSDYVPEVVHVITETGEIFKAICYNLPPTSLKGFNASYAHSLQDLAKSLGFPEDYVRQIDRSSGPDEI